MTFQITFVPAGLACASAGATSILQSAEAAAISLPSSCRSCLCRMQSGSVRYLVEWSGLSPSL